MSAHDPNEYSPEATKAQENTFADKSGQSASTTWSEDIDQTLQLGDQVVGFISGVIDLARVEVMLAVRTLPRLMMLWLLMMPIILLTWCAFSTLTAWAVVEISEELGLGIFTFLLQQILLLLCCRWLFIRYRQRLTLPYTRAQIDTLVRSFNHGSNHPAETKK